MSPDRCSYRVGSVTFNWNTTGALAVFVFVLLRKRFMSGSDLPRSK